MKLRVSDRLLLGLSVGGEVIDKLVSGGSRAYSSAKLFSWTPTGYSRRRYRHLVGRLVREGRVQQVVIDGQVQYRLTSLSRKHLLDGFPVLKSFGKAWDGWWRLVMFDVPESKRKQRDALRRELVRRGFGRFQDSSYISAYELDQSFLDWVQLKGLSGSVVVLEARQKYLGEPKSLANKVWKLETVGKGYQALIDKLTTRFGIKEAKKREDFIRRVYSDYLEVLLSDPFLPKELLPANWPADKCRQFVLQAGAVRE
jgi:phenylacetic acid degradation operon negative regulatory protein